METFADGADEVVERTFVNQECWAAQYEDRRPILDRASLFGAMEAYFLTPKA